MINPVQGSIVWAAPASVVTTTPSSTASGNNQESGYVDSSKPPTISQVDGAIDDGDNGSDSTIDDGNGKKTKTTVSSKETEIGHDSSSDAKKSDLRSIADVCLSQSRIHC